MYRVNLSYFKDTGKWYSDGTYNSEKVELYAIFDEVRNLKRMKKLPGLMEGHSDFIILIDVPEHPNNGPRIIPSRKMVDDAILVESLTRLVEDMSEIVESITENAS